ncbi:MAG: cytochrome c [Candidatus Eremiobacteraeota bacterium]|nr:cytochrome c [Candidatus Eremiobacteraeota bacterium]
MPARIFVLLGAVCLLASGCGDFHARNAKRTPPGVNAAHGKTLFSIQCAACHGAEGRGGPVGPVLRNERSRRSVRAIRDAIEFPSPPMPKLYPAQITRRDLEDVAAYVNQL